MHLVAHRSLNARPEQESRETDIDASGDEDRGRNDEKVLDNEIDDVVRISVSGEEAENVPNGFHRACEDQREERPEAVVRDKHSVNG